MRWAKALSRNDTEVGIRQCQAQGPALTILLYKWFGLGKQSSSLFR